ncbi:hypothetical protein ACHQM5_015875 [Ranunculus cassubicifolius]
MFGSPSMFGGNNNLFTPKPFGVNSGGSVFGGTSTGVFGHQLSSPLTSTSGFGIPSTTPALSFPIFGASGQTQPASGFGSTGSTFGQTQPASGFGSTGSMFGQTQPASGFGSTGSTFGQTQFTFGVLNPRNGDQVSSPQPSNSFTFDQLSRNKEPGVDIDALLPKLKYADYYTEPTIQELAVKEAAEPGFCQHVKDFVIGRHGYGRINFSGETDIQGLDLDALVQFNSREVIVYMDDDKKPPVGQGLNKPAVVTLLNIKFFDKKTGQQYTEGSKAEKCKELLVKKTHDQGAQFVSYDALKGEWKFKVDNF